VGKGTRLSTPRVTIVSETRGGTWRRKLEKQFHEGSKVKIY